MATNEAAAMTTSAVPHRADRAWEVLCHLSAILLFLGVPFGNIIGPLIVWALKHNESTVVDAHGKESLNFQLSLLLYTVVSTIATLILMWVVVGIFLLPFLIAWLVLSHLLGLALLIMASVKAANGELFHYPLTIRFLK